MYIKDLCCVVVVVDNNLIVVDNNLCCRQLLFAIVVDVIAENVKRDEVDELLYADDLVLISETMEDLKERFEIGRIHWKVRA